MKTKFVLLAWLSTFVVIFILNGIFHGIIAADFFDTQLTGLGDAAVKMKDFNPVPIAIMAFIMDFCLVIIITRMRTEKLVMKEAVITGGLFYLSAALSWNLANTATLISWPVAVTVVDVTWHFATGLLAGWIVCKLFNRQFAIN